MKKVIIAFIALWSYTWIVFMLQTIKSDMDMTWLFALFLWLFSAGFSFFMLYIFSKLEKIRLLNPTPSEKKYSFVRLSVFAITFVFFMLYLAAQYPGGMSPDTISQYEQAMTGDYNDWHPVLHTLLFFKIPILTGHRLGFIVYLQLSYFSLAFAYLVYVLYRYGFPKLLLCVLCVYVWVNPFLATYFMFPWKDIAFSIFAILLVAYYIQMIASKGVWLENKKNIILFSVVAVAAAFMRHNAILFVAPLVIIVLFYAAKKRQMRVGIVATIFICFILVKGLYSYLDVEAPSDRTLETVGLPVTVWCNVMQKNPDALPKETREVMYSLATQEAYEQNYISGNFNSIKWSETIDNEKIDEMSYMEVLDYTCQCFYYAPKESIEAVAKLTSLVWGIDGADSPITVTVMYNEWGIISRSFGDTFLQQMKTFFTLGIGSVLFGSYGMMICVMLVVGLALFMKGRISMIHLLPLFCYNFGTMLLLSGRDYRFFLLNILLWIPTIFIMCKDETKLPIKRKRNKPLKTLT